MQPVFPPNHLLLGPYQLLGPLNALSRPPSTLICSFRISRILLCTLRPLIRPQNALLGPYVPLWAPKCTLSAAQWPYWGPDCPYWASYGAVKTWKNLLWIPSGCPWPLNALFSLQVPLFDAKVTSVDPKMISLCREVTLLGLQVSSFGLLVNW